MTVEVADLSVAYDGTAVLQGLSLHVPAGGWLAVIAKRLDTAMETIRSVIESSDR